MMDMIQNIDLISAYKDLVRVYGGRPISYGQPSFGESYVRISDNSIGMGAIGSHGETVLRRFSGGFGTGKYAAESGEIFVLTKESVVRVRDIVIGSDIANVIKETETQRIRTQKQ